MKKLLQAAVCLMAANAGAQGFSLQGLLSYEDYATNSMSTAGFRQTYDFRMNHALTDTARFHIFFRGDDFRGSQVSPVTRRQASDSRQLQPGADFTLNTDTINVMARAEYFGLRSQTGDSESNRTIDRQSASATWSPLSLPTFKFLGQRTQTDDASAGLALTDQGVLTGVDYGWRGLHAFAQNFYSTSTDTAQGYARRSNLQTIDLVYAGTHLHDKLTVALEGNGQWTEIEQSATSGTASSVPTPVSISQALNAIDDTPLDGRDHPPQLLPSLIDGDLGTSTGISLGPDGVSFQNLVLDLGRIDRVDEIRVIVRDPAGNPLRNGGGPVTWDAYISQDGQIWTSLQSQTTFNAALCLYSVTFTGTTGRWFKVVNFGVNADPTLVTEIQAWYHTPIAPGQMQRGTQTAFTQMANVSVHPIQRLTVVYSGLYSAVRQEIAAQPLLSTNDLEHLATVQFDLWKTISLRAQYLRRNAENFDGNNDTAAGLTSFVDWTPTTDLKVTLEAGNENDVLQGSAFRMETRALHVTAFVLRSLAVTANAGTQTQEISTDASSAERRFADLTSTVQLLPTVRMLLLASYQKTNSQSLDPSVQLLGAPRDERITDEFLWRPGRELSLGVQIGWITGQDLSGFTERVHAEWFPFGDGTVSLGGSFDEDIDPTLNRRARRFMFNPRWLMNRHAAFDVNYSDVSSTLQSSNRQRTLIARLTLSR